VSYDDFNDPKNELFSDPNQQFYGQSPYPPNPGYPQPQPGYPPQSGYQQPQGYNPAYPHQAPYNPQPDMAPYHDPEDANKNFDFNDQSIRRAFIRKVYSILCVS